MTDRREVGGLYLEGDSGVFGKSSGTFIVWADSLGGDASIIEALSFDAARIGTPLLADDFVVITDPKYDPPRQWYGQITQPQLNLALKGLQRDNPSNIAAMERVLSGDVDRTIFLHQVYYYRIVLKGEIVDGRLESVAVRPTFGSNGCKATVDQVLAFSGLPAIQGETGFNNIIGVTGEAIPVTVDGERLVHHMLVAGATGSGKSNTVANLIKAGLVLGMAVVVFDHKPDYQDMDQVNDEGADDRFGHPLLKAFPIKDADYAVLYERGGAQRRTSELKIGVHASDVDADMLASYLMHLPSEGLQREVLSNFIRMYRDYREETHQSRQWALSELIDWAGKRVRYTDEKTAANSTDPFMVWSSTWLSMAGKGVRRKPDWIDAVVYGSGIRDPMFKDATPGLFDPQQSLKPGRALVIRIPTEGGQYGLFLSYFLREITELRRNKTLNCPVLLIIDEAQDIFNGDKRLRETAERMINEVLRKGRSNKIGFVISVQSASQVPDEMMTNLNSKIIHRQNVREELRNLASDVPKETLDAVLSLSPGEALIKMFGVTGVLRARMARSPFMLTKESFGA